MPTAGGGALPQGPALRDRACRPHEASADLGAALGGPAGDIARPRPQDRAPGRRLFLAPRESQVWLRVHVMGRGVCSPWGLGPHDSQGLRGCALRLPGSAVPARLGSGPGQGRAGLGPAGGPAYALSPCARRPAASGREKRCLTPMRSTHKRARLLCQVLGWGCSGVPSAGSSQSGGDTRQPASTRKGTGVTRQRQWVQEKGTRAKEAQAG